MIGPRIIIQETDNRETQGMSNKDKNVGMILTETTFFRYESKRISRIFLVKYKTNRNPGNTEEQNTAIAAPKLPQRGINKGRNMK
jgi:hypothetical protein